MNRQYPQLKAQQLILITLLGVQILLLFLIFPWFLVYFENEHIRQQSQQADQKMLSEPASSYSQGLYWSLITPINIEATHTWPQSHNSWILVRVSDATKVLTIGVMGRLFHNSLNIRRIRQVTATDYSRKGHPPTDWA